MSFKRSILAAALLAAVVQSASAAFVHQPLDFTVQNYTSNSLTFTLTGQMPSAVSTIGVPFQLDILYTGNLWTGGATFYNNALSASPVVAQSFTSGNTGGFALPWNYSWMNFSGATLADAFVTGAPVTLTWGGANVLNTNGTGSFDLYWGNLAGGPDGAGERNLLLGSVSVTGNAVPEPGTLALFGLSAAALGFARRRRQRG